MTLYHHINDFTFQGEKHGEGYLSTDGNWYPAEHINLLKSSCTEHIKLECMNKERELQNPVPGVLGTPNEEKVKIIFQQGRSFEADFEENTWSFKMPDKYFVSAGEYVIISLKEFEKLKQLL